MFAMRDEIVQFCQEFLKVNDFQDYCHNGLQVEGTSGVKKIVTGVSLSKKLIEAAIEKKSDMLIVHHGIFGDLLGSPPTFKGVICHRLLLLFQHSINLLGFHLPLDAHPEIGNNASLCRLLGVDVIDKLDIGFLGTLQEPMSLADFVAIIEERLPTHAQVLAAGKEVIQKVAIVSGGSSPYFQQAALMGADVFVCGDIREHVVRSVEEAGINFINAGHYNTEKLGIQNLGNLVAEKFGVEVEFVDIPCKI